MTLGAPSGSPSSPVWAVGGLGGCGLSRMRLFVVLGAVILLAICSSAVVASPIEAHGAESTGHLQPLPGIASAEFTLFSAVLTEAQTQRFRWARIDVRFGSPLALALPEAGLAAKLIPAAPAALVKAFRANRNSSYASESHYFSGESHPLNRLLSLDCPTPAGQHTALAAAAAARAAAVTSGSDRTPKGDDLESLLLSGAPVVLPAASAGQLSSNDEDEDRNSLLALQLGRRRAAQPLVRLLSLLSLPPQAGQERPNFPPGVIAGPASSAAEGGVTSLRVLVLLPGSDAAGAETSASALDLSQCSLAISAASPHAVAAAGAGAAPLLVPVTSGLVPLRPAASSSTDPAADDSDDDDADAATAGSGVLTAPTDDAALTDAALSQALAGSLRALRRQQRLRAARAAARRTAQEEVQRAEGLPSAPAGGDDFSIFLELDPSAATSPAAAATPYADVGVPPDAAARRRAKKAALLRPLWEAGAGEPSLFEEADDEPFSPPAPAAASSGPAKPKGQERSSLTEALMEVLSDPKAGEAEAAANKAKALKKLEQKKERELKRKAAKKASQPDAASAIAAAAAAAEAEEDAVYAAAVSASEPELGDMATVFFETAAKVEAVLAMESRVGLRAAAAAGADTRATAGARARTQQILAAIVDPICEMVPPIMGEVSMNAVLPLAAKTIKGAIGDVMMDAYIPAETEELLGPISSQPERDSEGNAQTQLMDVKGAMARLKVDDINIKTGEEEEKERLRGQPDSVSAKAGATAFLELEARLNAAAGAAAGRGDVEANTGEPQQMRGSIDMGVKTSLANKLVAAFMTGAVPEAQNLMHQSMSFNVAKLVNNTVTREVSRSLGTALTLSLVESLTATTFRIFSQSITRLGTQALTRVTIETLGNAVSQTVTRALTRTPVADVFCELCRMGPEVYRQTAENIEEFCDACWSAETAGQQTEHYTGAYARHFTQYYAWHYGGYYSRLFADDYLLDRANFNVPVPIPPTKKG